MQSKAPLEEFYPSTLSMLFFGDEQHEPLEKTLDDILSPDFQQRVNGKIYGRDEFLPHVREMRGTVVSGTMEVLEQVREGNRIAGRYLFHVVTVGGGKAHYESHIMGEVDDDGRILRQSEVARVVEDTDDSDLNGRR
jgi:hypothetical protein